MFMAAHNRRVVAAVMTAGEERGDILAVSICGEDCWRVGREGGT
jgi:hypothetical protein